MKNLLNLGMVALSISASALVNTCPIALENNTQHPILVHTNDELKSALAGDASAMVKSNAEKTLTFTLAPGEKRTFGRKGLHAEFSLIEQNPMMRAESIIEIRQHSCSKSPEPVALKASDLLAGRYEPAFFNFHTTKNGTNK